MHKNELSTALVKQIYSLLDLTSLNNADDSAAIAALCAKAVLPTMQVAAVCVYPQFVSQAVAALRETTVNVATVVNFPAGNDSLAVVIAALEQALRAGAQEIDVVFPYSRYLAGDKEFAAQFIRACKLACGNNILKVILETGALQDLEVIADVSDLVIAAGADFLKTSTGKIAVGATIDAAAVMLNAIKTSGAHVGFKVSGGVRTIAQALEYMALAESILGATFVTPKTFRIGASQLADVLAG
jgi:deoxyribose-phosphate aldolase